MPCHVTTTRQAATIDLAGLTDEMLAALGVPITVLMWVAEDGTATLSVLAPDGCDSISATETEIRDLVTAHVPPTRVGCWDVFVAAITAATDLADTQAALLALADNFRDR